MVGVGRTGRVTRVGVSGQCVRRVSRDNREAEAEGGRRKSAEKNIESHTVVRERTTSFWRHREIGCISPPFFLQSPEQKKPN